MPDIIAETERLVLRTIEEGDAELRYQLLNSPAVMERLGGPKELHEIEAKHAKSMQLQARYGFSFLFLIMLLRYVSLMYFGMSIMSSSK